MRKKLIKKIYLALNHNKVNKDSLVCRIISFVLKYFLLKLKKLKNAKIFTSLRLLFILIEEY
jgi:hypothetical protein